MANAVQVQILQDGPRNTVAKFTGELDTSNEAYNVKLAPATYRTTYSLGPYGTPATWRIDFLEFAISDGIEVQLFWDATTPQVILPISGRGNKHFKNFGGISGYLAQGLAGWTGGIGLSAVQLPGVTYTAGEPFVYTIVLDLVQQGPNLS
jgi:hypothetical protein